MSGGVGILGFVNHIPPADDIERSIERAFDWGVDVVVAQGTGSDWGPFWLGSGEQPQTNVAANVRPYVRAALAHGVPFIFSFGIAGANVHLDRCLEHFDDMCAEDGLSPRIAVIRSELDRDKLARWIEAGVRLEPASSAPELERPLSSPAVGATERVVGLIGPEPVVAALDAGVDGVITGRALDIGLFMALPMLRGIPTSVAAHAGKLLECGGLGLEPGDSGQCIWARVEEDGFEVRSPNPRLAATPRALVSHTFYERAHPALEDNPGGTLDLTEATYAESELGVRCAGARWHERPYAVLLEGARRVGYRAISVLAVREPTLLEQIRSWADRAVGEFEASPRFHDEVAAGRLRVAVRIFGLDGVLGLLEPEQGVTGHEASVIVDAVGPTEELAQEAAYYAFIRLFIGPYPGRKTTAGNAAAPFMPVVIPAASVYEFAIYHLLPLEDPCGPFPFEVRTTGPARAGAP